MTRITNNHVYVETSVGKGYIDRDRPSPHGRLTHPRFLPYVILADGTREELGEARNLRGLGDSAIDMLRDRLQEGPRIHAPEPEEPCRCLSCKHFGGHQ